MTQKAAAGSSATSDASTRPVQRWAARPWIARLVRLTAVTVPLAASIIISQQAGSLVARPRHLIGAIGWWVVMIAISVVSFSVIERLSRRILPLALLFQMTLAFPDVAPSRFGTALRGGSTKRLQERLRDGSAEDPAADLLALVARMSDHDRLTRGHSERVRAYSVMIGQEIGLSADDIDRLQWAALVHDVGKLDVPAEVLNKPGKPTEAEWQILRGHPAAAGDLLVPLGPWLGEWLLAATQHHERFDGKGYPAGLRGEEISLAGRIVGVADAYDVMTSARSYKKPFQPMQARDELRRNAGSQFDPTIVRAFLNIGIERHGVAWRTAGLFGQVPLTSATTAGLRLAAVTAVSTAAALGAAPALSAERPARETVPVVTSTTIAPPADGPVLVEPAAPSAPGNATTPTTATTRTTTTTTGTGSAGSATPDVASDTTISTAATTSSTTAEVIIPGPATVATTRPSAASTTTAPSTTAPSVTTTAPPITVPRTTVPTPTLPVTTPPVTTPPVTTFPVTTLPVTTLPPITISPVTVPATTLSPILPSAATASLAVFLTNPGSGDTTSSLDLPLDAAPATDAGLANFDTDRDTDAGLRLRKDSDGSGANGTDSRRFQDWMLPISTATSVDGRATVTLWIAPRDFSPTRPTGVQVVLQACASTCDTIASASATTSGGAWQLATIDLGPVSGVLTAGSALRLRVTVPSALSNNDVVLAYDSLSFPSALVIAPA